MMELHRGIAPPSSRVPQMRDPSPGAPCESTRNGGLQRKPHEPPVGSLVPADLPLVGVLARKLAGGASTAPKADRGPQLCPG